MASPTEVTYCNILSVSTLENVFHTVQQSERTNLQFMHVDVLCPPRNSSSLTPVSISREHIFERSALPKFMPELSQGSPVNNMLPLSASCVLMLDLAQGEDVHGLGESRRAEAIISELNLTL